MLNIEGVFGAPRAGAALHRRTTGGYPAIQTGKTIFNQVQLQFSQAKIYVLDFLQACVTAKLLILFSVQ